MHTADKADASLIIHASNKTYCRYAVDSAALIPLITVKTSIKKGCSGSNKGQFLKP
jgi:hypothetical protein